MTVQKKKSVVHTIIAPENDCVLGQSPMTTTYSSNKTVSLVNSIPTPVTYSKYPKISNILFHTLLGLTLVMLNKLRCHAHF